MWKHTLVIQKELSVIDNSFCYGGTYMKTCLSNMLYTSYYAVLRNFSEFTYTLFYAIFK